MTDQKNTNKTTAQMTKKIVEKNAEALTETTEKVAEAQTEAVQKTADAAKANVAKTAKRAKRTTAKAAKAQKKTIDGAAKAAATMNKKTKENTMTNFDMNSWFGGYDVPNAQKVEEMMTNAGKQGEEFIAKSRVATEQLAEMTKANVEAMIESTRIAATGAKDLGTELIEESRSQFESASDNMRLLAEAKTPQDFMAIQADLYKSSFDRMISESSKMTERMVKLAGDAMQPVSNRASVNAEKVKSLMA
ncbi:phasin family protein [Sphingomicrobium sp. XHP0239]|uniref:phasin family protein n=1 Tax=Sphingomicrobium maritimum TaxID=3133972 RepID=UPI0031CC861C